GLATLVVEGTLVAAVVVQLQPSDWADLWGNFGHLKQLRWSGTASGFAAAWLSYSGLESLGQLAPAGRPPRPQRIRLAAAPWRGWWEACCSRCRCQPRWRSRRRAPATSRRRGRCWRRSRSNTVASAC